MDKKKIRVGITHGDINGIGYELIIKTFSDARLAELCVPIIYGSPKVLAYHRNAINVKNFNAHNINDADDSKGNAVNLINCLEEDVRVELGRPTDVSGESALLSLDRAIADLFDNKIDVLVTAPINKNIMPWPDKKFTGHTEYLANKFSEDRHMMLMVSQTMKVGIVAGHVPLKQVPEFITKESIIEKLGIFNQSLIEDFGIRKPRIAVFGLNPHAGDQGMIGTEEKEIIEPAIEEARAKGIMAIGPYAADGFFGVDSYTKFDGILAMYHDQGLAPFKALVFDSGVNYTAGLPIVRTSPSHGTAYQIAGQGVASEDSFRNAVYMALDIYKNRNDLHELKQNTLETHAKQAER